MIFFTLLLFQVYLYFVNTKVFYTLCVFLLTFSNVYVGILGYKYRVNIFVAQQNENGLEINYSPWCNMCHYQFGAIMGALYFEYSEMETKETHLFYRVGKYFYFCIGLGVTLILGALCFYIPLNPKDGKIDVYYSRTAILFLAPLVPLTVLTGLTIFLLPFISGILFSI